LGALVKKQADNKRDAYNATVPVQTIFRNRFDRFQNGKQSDTATHSG